MNICADILNNVDTDPGLLDTVTLKGTRFESVEAVKAKATEVLNQLTGADLQHCFQQWKSRMERCRDRRGEYIEGEKVATVIGFGNVENARRFSLKRLEIIWQTDRPAARHGLNPFESRRSLAACPVRLRNANAAWMAVITPQ
ncbi:hypothetical protein NQ318_018903 [Aromia moschata]|uniref:Uncharacterized protein n=1 Tax=Aromia moschata TaxID=1265417 RepID=A0AAV8ZI64_9CUCU|nr:hypothetical protein NQ318_018903 [Aromia moschata]